jgi:site-specific DNA-methyltransferase (adenine-specific)
MYNTILLGDCLDKLQSDVATDSVDLIVTSPPYADQRKSTYGGIHPDKYVEWFLPRSAELQRVLKPTGSFVLNIKEKAVDGERHTYVLELILELKKQGWCWVEEYVWHKKNCSPGKWPNRFRDAWERCLHFTKQKKGFKMNQDAVKVPIGDWAKERFAKPSVNDKIRLESDTKSGFSRKVENWRDRDTVFPSNVLHLPSNEANTCDCMESPSNVLHLASECGNKNHSAAFPSSLPEFFIKLFSDAGDVVLDPFVGSGTTVIVAKEMGRQYVGVEMKQEYFDMIQKKMNTASVETGLLPE